METVPEENPQEGAENNEAKASSSENAPAPKSKSPKSKSKPTNAAAPTAPPSTSAKPASSSSFAVPSVPHDPPKKSKREDRNKKDDEYVKAFMKAINAASSHEEKMQLAVQKYAHMVDDNKKMQFYIKQSEKRHTLLVKEKDQLQLEFNKTILVKSKLENLCRELQKQNKSIKEESLLKIREEEERRKETQSKFQNTLSEITALLQQNNEKNAKLREDNIGMTEKFKNVVTQYQLREQQIEKMAKQMALEQQLADAKFMKAGLEHQAERERLLAEIEGLKVSVQQHRARVMDLQGTETGLRSQLAVYTDKYDEFQNALVKSNQVFGGFKDEMDKMSKKIKKLEKESLSWKKRWETSQSALLDMCGERQASDERAAAAARQLHNMQSLCRTLQAERTVLLGALKENNIERPPLPAPVPAPPPPPPPAHANNASNAKVDAMAANCAQLRQSLAHLQSQLNVLTTKQQQPAAEEPAKPEKTKKSKSKKSKKQATPKESESDSNAKESANESANEDKVKTEKVEGDADKPTEKVTVENEARESKEDVVEAIVEDKALESLIEAINNANIDLCDLEVAGEDEATKSTDTASAEASEIETSNKDSSNEVSPKNGPKSVNDEVTNGLDDSAKIVELADEIANGPKLVEITDEIANRPKIIELPDNYVVPKDMVTNVGVPKDLKDAANTEIKAMASGDSSAQATDA